VTLDFYFDFISPWAYLASTQVERIAATHDTTVRWIPVKLERIRELTERETAPYTPTFMQYTTKDLLRWAQRYKVQVNLPIDVPTTSLLHGYFYAESQDRASAYIHRAFQSRWANSDDVSDEAVLRAIATDSGLDADAFLAATTDSANAERLEANSAAAAALGIFGVPTCAVGDEIFWGNDRLDFVEEALAAAR